MSVCVIPYHKESITVLKARALKSKRTGFESQPWLRVGTLLKDKDSFLISKIGMVRGPNTHGWALCSAQCIKIFGTYYNHC